MADNKPSEVEALIRLSILEYFKMLDTKIIDMKKQHKNGKLPSTTNGYGDGESQTKYRKVSK